jgi:biotin carboxyl carrier protein
LASTEILAPTAGLVVKVSVSQGATVSAGDTVAVLQSMKTEISITTDVGGTVSQVHVKKGDEVTIGQALVEIQS